MKKSRSTIIQTTNNQTGVKQRIIIVDNISNVAKRRNNQRETSNLPKTKIIHHQRPDSSDLNMSDSNTSNQSQSSTNSNQSSLGKNKKSFNKLIKNKNTQETPGTKKIPSNNNNKPNNGLKDGTSSDQSKTSSI